ncbi:hypothetical protein L204_100964 [Cryptococcus depauperatus]
MVSHATSNLGDREIDIASDALPVVATLRERLDVWRKAPGEKGEIEGEVEHGGFMKWNLEQCSTINEQHSTHMIQHCTNSWMSLNRTTLHDDLWERDKDEKKSYHLKALAIVQYPWKKVLYLIQILFPFAILNICLMLLHTNAYKRLGNSATADY